MARDSKKKAEGKADGHRRFVRYCVVLLVGAGLALAWLSLLTFSPTDPPSPAVYPPKRPVDNAAGVVGAYLAYELRYWLGGGAYMGLLFATVAGVLVLLGGRLGELPWRLLGVGLLIAATGAGIYLLDPGSSENLHDGLAGVVGVGAGRLLLVKLGVVGGWIVVAAALCTGVLLAADNLVLQLPRVGRKAFRGAGRVGGALRGAAKPLRDIRRARAEAEPSSPKPAAPPTPAPEAPPPKPDQAPAPKPVTLVPKASAEPAAEKRSSGSSGGSGGKSKRPYNLPDLDLLAEPMQGYTQSQQRQAGEKQAILQQTLNDFGVEAEVVGYMTGPVITLYELSVAPGVKVAQVANLATDIARALAVPGVRIVPPRFGKRTIGVEVPNSEKEIVRLKELMRLNPEAERKMRLPLYLGKDAGGEAIVADLAGMPHMLIAGTTGSGKSVCINSILMSLLMTRTPDEVRFILVDPKMVEMAAFERVPHLLCPIINDVYKAEELLEWAATKMDERYEVLKEARVRNISQFNALEPDEIYRRFEAADEEEKARIPTSMPHYIVIIDELADLMMTSSKEVETHIIRIAQKARAVGIHLVLATQRPSANVVTGLIKSNMPCRISFRVASGQESRIVLDQNGADVLLGQGDMLFLQPGTSNLVRAQGAFVDDAEIHAVLKRLVTADGEPTYLPELVRLNSRQTGETTDEKDPLFDDAVEVVLSSRRGSVSLLQRRLQIGYSRASRIVDQMADAGILGDHKGSQARECLLTLEDWEQMKAGIQADQSGESSLNGQPTSA